MDASLEPSAGSRKRKLSDEWAGGMLKKRWVIPGSTPPSPQQPTRKRLFTAIIDEKTMDSVVNLSAKRSRGVYFNPGTITKVPKTVNLSLNQATGTSQMLKHCIPVLESKAAQAIIKYTPRERFWLSCIAAALRSNAKETWIVMPASEGGQIFQLSLESNNTSGLSVEVSEVFSADEHISGAEPEPGRREVVDMMVEEVN